MAQKQPGGRFASLRSLRTETNDEHDGVEIVEPKTDRAPELAESKPEPQHPQAEATPAESTPKRRRPGRPPGRRSNPDYTQLSAYIPLELLLSIQDELAKERREQQQRTARPVSDLIEELLRQWIQSRQADASDHQ